MTNNIVNYLILFIGVIMVLLSYFVLRRQSSTFVSSDDQMLKEKELKIVEYIDIAEEIIEELNTVSEQIIQGIDVRTAELCRMMEEIDNKLNNYKEIIHKQPLEVLRNNDEVIDVDMGIETDHRSDDEELLNSPSETTKEDDIKHLTTREILRLFDEGNSPAQIARCLNKGIGEVQLILNLRKR